MKQSLHAFVDVLRYEIQHKFTVICQVIPRRNSPFPKYNRRVKKLNKCLRDTLADSSVVKFWRHRGLNNPTRDIYVRDGIHLNKRGHKALYRSYRGALLYALKQIQHIQELLTQPGVIIRILKKHLRYICFRTGIPLINAAGVVITWGILSCLPVAGFVYAISIVCIGECQKHFIKRSAVILRTLF